MAERSVWRPAAALAILLAGHPLPVRGEEVSDGARAATRPEPRRTFASAMVALGVRRWAGRALRALGVASDGSDAQPEAVVTLAGWGCEV